jgi:hypothetical protein
MSSYYSMPHKPLISNSIMPRFTEACKSIYTSNQISHISPQFCVSIAVYRWTCQPHIQIYFRIDILYNNWAFRWSSSISLRK